MVTAKAQQASFVIDDRQRIAQWGDAIAVLIGVPPHAAVGRPCHEVVQGCDQSGKPVCQPNCPAFKALQAGQPRVRCPIVRTSTGTDLPKGFVCELVASPSLPGGAMATLLERSLVPAAALAGSPAGTAVVVPGIPQARWPSLGVLPKLARVAKQKPLGAVSAVVILLLVLAALFAGALSPYDPLALSGRERLLPMSRLHPLGTDNLGRDMLSRIIYGARISLWVGLIAVTIASGLGTVVGVASAYAGGKMDLVAQRIVDTVQSIPGLILALVIVAVLGASITNVIIAIAIIMVPSNSRVIRSAALSAKEQTYIESAKAIGCSHLRIMARHILPNVVAPIIVLGSLLFGEAILIEASLSFLGVGTPPPTPTWGGMLSGAGRQYMERMPTLALFPGLAISLAVLAFNLLGDALRDVLDPRLRGSR